MKHAWIVTIAALCAGCSSDSDIQPVPPSEALPTESEKPGNESGSRLRKIDRVGADGSREFAGWYDSERDEDCAFRTVPASPAPITRCFSDVDITTGVAIRFADSTCTEPLAVKHANRRAGRAGAPLREYALHPWGHADGDAARMYLVGDRVYAEGTASKPVMVQWHEMYPPGPCTMHEAAAFNGTLAYLEKISIDDFVSWTEVVDGLDD